MSDCPMDRTPYDERGERCRSLNSAFQCRALSHGRCVFFPQDPPEPVEEKTVHALNWARPTQTVCGLTVVGRAFSKLPIETTCDVCSLRLLRLGQKAGLTTKSIALWTFEEIAEGLKVDPA